MQESIRVYNGGEDAIMIFFLTPIKDEKIIKTKTREITD